MSAICNNVWTRVPKLVEKITWDLFLLWIFYIAVNFSRIVPDGLLVFFPSYYLLDKCIECWKTMVGRKISLDERKRKVVFFFSCQILFQLMQRDANSMTIWERILKHKKAVVEPRQSSLFLESIEVAYISANQLSLMRLYIYLQVMFQPNLDLFLTIFSHYFSTWSSLNSLIVVKAKPIWYWPFLYLNGSCDALFSHFGRITWLSWRTPQLLVQSFLLFAVVRYV